MAVKNQVKLVGIGLVVKNLNREIRKIRGRTKAGLWLAAQFVKGASLVKTPVDTGNLRQSAYVTAFDSSAGPGADIGYTAAYAVYVHEIDKNYRAPGTSWKYLERALTESRKAVLEIIARTAKVRR